MITFNFPPDINECVTSNPCKNGATCLNTPGSYRCTCQPGFKGSKCGKGDDLSVDNYNFK